MDNSGRCSKQEILGAPQEAGRPKTTSGLDMGDLAGVTALDGGDMRIVEQLFHLVERAAKEPVAPCIPDADARRLFALFEHARYCPGHHKCRKHDDVCTAAKFVMLSPDQQTEVDAIKLSLNLNIAMCWLKISDAENHLDQAIRACDDALKIDGESVRWKSSYMT